MDSFFTVSTTVSADLKFVYLESDRNVPRQSFDVTGHDDKLCVAMGKMVESMLRLKLLPAQSPVEIGAAAERASLHEIAGIADAISKAPMATTAEVIESIAESLSRSHAVMLEDRDKRTAAIRDILLRSLHLSPIHDEAKAQVANPETRG